MVDIEAALVNRKVWLAASTHSEEENGYSVNPSLQKHVLLEQFCTLPPPGFFQF